MGATRLGCKQLTPTATTAAGSHITGKHSPALHTPHGQCIARVLLTNQASRARAPTRLSPWGMVVADAQLQDTQAGLPKPSVLSRRAMARSSFRQGTVSNARMSMAGSSATACRACMQPGHDELLAVSAAVVHVLDW